MPRPGFSAADQKHQRQVVLGLATQIPRPGVVELARQAGLQLGRPVSESTVRGILKRSDIFKGMPPDVFLTGKILRREEISDLPSWTCTYVDEAGEPFQCQLRAGDVQVKGWGDGVVVHRFLGEESSCALPRAHEQPGVPK